MKQGREVYYIKMRQTISFYRLLFIELRKSIHLEFMLTLLMFLTDQMFTCSSLDKKWTLTWHLLDAHLTSSICAYFGIFRCSLDASWTFTWQSFDIHFTLTWRWLDADLALTCHSLDADLTLTSHSLEAGNTAIDHYLILFLICIESKYGFIIK